MLDDNGVSDPDDKLDKILERHVKFWQIDETDRTLIGLSQFGYFPLEDFDLGIKDGAVLPSMLNPSRFLSQYEELFSRGGLYMGDLLWAANPIWGLPWLEAIIGCEVEVRNEDTSLWARKVYASLDDVQEVKLFFRQ